MAKKKNKEELMEKASVASAAPAEPMAEEAQKYDFDAWYALRGGRIPRQHHKEILKADFKARGLGQCESLEDFDAALKKYGVELS